MGAAHEEESRDFPYYVVTLIKQMSFETCHDIKKQSHQMNSVSTKDNSITIKMAKKMKQCACDKVFYIATDISTKDKAKADFMS